QRVGENLYFSFDQYRNSSGFLFRIFEDSVFIYADTAEYLWYDFNVDSGDSWIVPPLGPPYFGGAFTMQSKTDTTVTPVGTFTDCYRIHHFIGVDAEFIEWFADEIGIVQRDVITIAGLRRWTLVDRLTTSVSDEPELANPINYLLSQNYPNPFNPSTIIKYQIPDVSFVTIKVYDVLGNEITTLVSEEKQTGTYELTWYAEKLPSGIYFYRLQSGSFVETKKMVLLK
ncbi:MAG: T9SS type A sorting domain-containing protein, partial [Candidatus Kariarchaeaceae archaeon]